MKGKFDSVSFGFQPLIHFLPGHWDTEMAFWLVLGLMSIDIFVVLHEKCRSQHMNKASAMAVLQSRLDQLEIARQAQMNAEHTQSLNEISWGNQIRSYVLHPYRMVKDLRTNYEVSDPDSVLEGDLDDFILNYLSSSLDEGDVSV